MTSTVPALLLALAHAVALDADAALRVDALSTTLKAPGVPLDERVGWAATPALTGILDFSQLRMTAGYAPRIWTGDVGARPEPLVDHVLEARLETRTPEPWRWTATAGVARGHTDVRPDPARSVAAEGLSQVTASAAYQRVQGALATEVLVGPRTTVGAAARWEDSRTTGLPDQQGVGADASAGYLVTERDTMRAGVRANQVWTRGSRSPVAHSRSIGALATWRRRLTTVVDGWVAAGGTWLDSPGAGPRLEPAGELGVARAGDGSSVTAEGVVRASTFVDRYTGEVRPFVEARLGLGWRATERLSFSTSGSGGTRTDGVTSMATADVRATWRIRESLAFEAGALWRGQHERASARPSFVETAAFASLSWRSERIFGRAADAAERTR